MARGLAWLAGLLVKATAVIGGATDDDCMSMSVGLAQMTISNARISVADSTSTDGSSVEFLLRNSANGVNVTCSATSVALTPKGPSSDPEKWYNCTFVPERDITTQFQYNAAVNTFAVDTTWICEDKPANHTVLFEATGGDTIQVSCQNGPGLRSSCTQLNDVDFDVGIALTRLSL